MTPQQTKLSPSTKGFVLAAGIAVLFNTALAWAKDSSPPLNTLMGKLLGHHWTTHGVADLVVFLALGLIFSTTGAGAKLESGRVINFLIGSVVAASLGLALWFALV